MNTSSNLQIPDFHMDILCMFRAVPELVDYPILFSMMGGLFCQDRRLLSG